MANNDLKQTNTPIDREALKKAYMKYLSTPTERPPKFGISDIGETIKRGIGEPDTKKSTLSKILGGIKGGIEGLARTVTTPEGQKVLAGLSKDPYTTKAYLGQAEKAEARGLRQETQAQGKEAQRMKDIGAYLKTPEMGAGGVPQGFEITGYSATGRPMIRKIADPRQIYQVTSTGELETVGKVSPKAKVYKKGRTFEELLALKEAGAKIGTAETLVRKKAEKELKKGHIPAEQAGRYVLAQESLRNIEDVKNILFPDGTPKSFRRDIAFKSDIPFIGKMPMDEKAQKVAQKLATVLAGRVLIQTGVAARPEEVETLRKAFLPSLRSDPKASLQALEILDKFYKDYVSILKGEGETLKNQPSTPPNFNSIEEANAANLPIGTVITIQGRRFVNE